VIIDWKEASLWFFKFNIIQPECNISHFSFVCNWNRFLITFQNRNQNQFRFIKQARKAQWFPIHSIFSWLLNCKTPSIPLILNCFQLVYMITFSVHISCFWRDMYTFCEFYYKSKSSVGFLIFCKLRILTCVYISVVLLLLCPNSSCIYLRSTPASSKWVA
jgi:hypothetical protein